jgi:hypothetical protein
MSYLRFHEGAKRVDVYFDDVNSTPRGTLTDA